MDRRKFVSVGSFGLLGLGASISLSRSAWAGRFPSPDKDEKAHADVPDEPGLPRVLLLGDSISMGEEYAGGRLVYQGYEVRTRELLKGKANIHGIEGNGGNTRYGLQHLSQWLGDGRWAVIHFNWGLHDLARKSNWPSPTGEYHVPVDEYERNLGEIVSRLKATGATLVWATTTPIPDKITNVAANRRNGDAIRYNAAARKVMEENHIAIDDLYSFALPRLKEIQQPDDVHFTFEGSAVLARSVAASILTALKHRKDRRSEPGRR